MPQYKVPQSDAYRRDFIEKAMETAVIRVYKGELAIPDLFNLGK